MLACVCAMILNLLAMHFHTWPSCVCVDFDSFLSWFASANNWRTNVGSRLIQYALLYC